MVGKNNNYIRESKSNEHFQRFSLRKLSVGVVSVAVAAGFYLGSGTTAQAATTEPDTSAKTEQVVQQDATSAASDSASASNSSAAVSTSSATPVSAESASSAAVSDSPASASAASDNQASAVSTSENSSQPASSSVASDAASAVSEKSQAASEANSQSAADKQTAQLSTSAANVNESQAANIILSALVAQQAANQQAPAGFTVTDPDYPAGMYQDTVASHYTYWWAQSSDGNYSLVLSTDRNGDGKVYVFLLGRNNNVLGQYTVDKNDSADVIFDYGLRKYSFGTVYNDGQSGVFVSSGRTWKSKFNVFDPEASKDNGDYGSISFMIPQVETQTTTYVDDKGNTVTYVDDKGKTVSIDPVVQKGLDGQRYTTQGGKVIKGYFAKEPSNANGYMSPFGKQGATYVKDLHNGYKATFKEINTATGEMQVVVTFNDGYDDYFIEQFNLKYGDAHYVEEAHWNIHSIYIPQTINIQYVYEKLGDLIIESDPVDSADFPPLPPEYKPTSTYPNDENDSTKAGNVKIPEVPGFTPTINGMINGKVKTYTLTDKDYNPADKSYTFNPSDYVSDLSQDITVVYKADDQKATVKYIDDTTGKTLDTKSLSGKTNAKSGYTTAKDIQAYKDLGYVLVSDSTNGAEIVFDNDDKSDQTFVVHFKHGTQDANDSRTKTLIVHYQYADKNKAADDRPSTPLTFTRKGTKDLVTGDTTWQAWDQPSQTFATVKSPTIPGYTPDQTAIDGVTVNADSPAQTEKTVIYTANAQKATVTYIDDTTGKTLDTKSLTGNSDTQSDYTTKDAIKQYTDQHYVLVSDDTKGQPITFDHDDKSDQTFVVHFKHGTQDANDSRTKTLIVHYQYADKNKAADDRPSTPLTFTRKGTKDLVTGDTTWQAWDQPSQTFATVKSPTIPGYTPDQTAIDGVTVNADSPAQTEKTVIYTANAQKATVTYIDDTTGKTLDTKSLTGNSDTQSDYTTKDAIKQYTDQHYVLVSDDTKGQPITFDHDDKNDQAFEVHLKHGTTHTNATDENAEQKTVTETIHYVYENNQTAQPDYTAAVTFKRGYTTDNVIDKVVSYDPWTIDGKQADSKTFAAVTSPAVEGYTPNHKQINEFTVTPGSKDIVKTVVYVGDPQEAQAIFYDETTGKEISNTREIVNGKTDEAISFTKDPNEVVKELEKQGYVFDKDNANNNVFVAGTTYDKNSEVHQYFKYYFTHATTIVTPDNPKTPADVLPDNPGKNYPSGVAKDDLNKTVTRTINITTPDGKTQTITQKAEFTRSATVDEVTGEVTYGPWSKNVVLESVDVPNIPGYVPSASVPEITVTPNDQDMTINITYKKLDSGKATDQGGNASNGGQATNGGSTTGQSAQNGQSSQTQNNAGAQQLPQTGNANNEKGALGLAGAMFAAGLGLGFGSKKKRHEN